jgi:N-succinyldiaminopimelate aminotransferase
MNPRLDLLQAYPFERLRALTADITPSAAHPHISLGLGEPQHPTPPLIRDALVAALEGLAHYPATAGLPVLRQACAQWVQRRYGVPLDANTQILPVNGSREALFSLAQAVVGARAGQPRPVVVSPNPFYQIYEGAALLAGAELAFINADASNDLACDWTQLDEATWARTQLVFVCSPGNPTGAVMSLDDWRRLFELSDRHGFVIASDECYSEIYFGDTPPLGGLEAAWRLGRQDLRRLVMLTSLSKRSNAPGLRSGFVAGDAAVLRDFLRYRTYHGSAMSTPVQHASLAAWNDETHVVDNRRLYKEKFEAVVPLLQEVTPVRWPDAGFYIWLQVPRHCCGGSDTEFARQLLSQYNVTVLPGSFLAREARGLNPGAGRVRLALVARPQDCVEAARRIASFIRSHPS